MLACPSNVRFHVFWIALLYALALLLLFLILDTFSCQDVPIRVPIFARALENVDGELTELEALPEPKQEFRLLERKPVFVERLTCRRVVKRTR